MPRRTAAVAAVVIACLASLVATLSRPAAARAATYTYCYTDVYEGRWCPDRSAAAGARHTFVNMVGNWGTVTHSGCDIHVWVGADVAYTSSNGGEKYSADGCNIAVKSFPNNTQLLREYVLWTYWSGGSAIARFMYGYGDY